MDWIKTFMEHTDGRPTPEIFRLWSGISCLAGALERRVWIRTQPGPLYPNLYVMLVAPPAIGKGIAMYPARDLWRSTKGKIRIAPASTTKASLLDEVEKSGRKIPIKNGTDLFEYHSLNIASTEFTNFMNSYDNEFLGVMIQLYDAETFPYVETRRHAKSVDLTNPSLNMIAGTQPVYLAGLLPEEAWGGGFMSRVIMTYAAVTPEFDLWDIPSDDIHKPRESILAEYILKTTEVIGQFEVTQDAKDFVTRWYKSGFQPVPEHSKLQHYNGRRGILLLKLSMIASISESLNLTINSSHIERALGWLIHAETFMPDVFRNMEGKGDSQVIQHLHHEVWARYAKTKKPIHESFIYDILRRYVDSYRAPRILELCCKANIIQRLAGTDTYIPRGKHEWGVE